MRNRMISIVHLVREHKVLSQKLRAANDDQELRNNKEELTDRLIASMSEELMDQARDLEALKARSSRNRYF